MNLDHYRQLFGYTFWANKLLLELVQRTSR